MTLNDYQKAAMKTCMPSSNNFSYMMLNLVGEVGEFASKVAKSIRKEKMEIDSNDYYICGAEFTKSQILKMNKSEMEEFAKDLTYDAIIDMQLLDTELKIKAGNVLKGIASLCSVMGWNLEDVSQISLISEQASNKE